MRHGVRSKFGVVAVLALVVGTISVVGPSPAGATTVGDESSLRTAFANAAETSVVLTADITLTDCGSGVVGRVSATPVTLDGQGQFTITQTCPDVAVLASAGGGGLTVLGVTLAGGNVGVQSDGPTVVQASRVTGQTATSAGAYGILVDAGSLILTDTEIDGITAYHEGIGAVNIGGALTATRVSVADISGGTAASGHGSNAAGLVALSMAVTDSRITDVDAAGSSGLYSIGGGIVMTGTTIRNLTGDEQLTHGVYAEGTAVVTDSSITDVFGALGVGVFARSSHPITVTRSTIARVAGKGMGIGIYAERDSTVQVVNSTITSVQGPAVAALGDATIVYSTISDSGTVEAAANAVSLPGSGSVTRVAPYVAQVVVENSLVMFGSVVVRNAVGDPNCDVGSTASAGYNFADDTSCGLTGTGDRQGAGLDAMLGALTDNGGPGPTRLPQAGSPLLDAIPNDACQTGPAVGITTDERSLPRPALGGCDIGAVEVQPPPEPTFTG